jgi:hypothetical protein
MAPWHWATVSFCRTCRRTLGNWVTYLSVSRLASHASESQWRPTQPRNRILLVFIRFSFCIMGRKLTLYEQRKIKCYFLKYIIRGPISCRIQREMSQANYVDLCCLGCLVYFMLCIQVRKELINIYRKKRSRQIMNMVWNTKLCYFVHDSTFNCLQLECISEDLVLYP